MTLTFMWIINILDLCCQIVWIVCVRVRVFVNFIKCWKRKQTKTKEEKLYRIVLLNKCDSVRSPVIDVLLL